MTAAKAAEKTIKPDEGCAAQNGLTAYALEPRILFDGAAAATADAATHEAAPAANGDHQAAADVQSLLAAAAGLNPPESSNTVQAIQENHAKTEIVFIENNVADYRNLIAGVKSGTEVRVLDAGGDGLAQMADILAGRNGIGALHIVSHGSEAALGLGALHLTGENVSAHADALGVIGGALTADADILLYGCDVSKGSGGAAFVEALARYAGADVAASDDATGAAELGGDWSLETQTGAVETEAAFSRQAMQDYGHTLSAFTEDFDWSGRPVSDGANDQIDPSDFIIDSDSGTSQAPFYDFNVNGTAFRLTASPSGDKGTAQWRDQFGQGNSNSVELNSGAYSHADNTAAVDTFTITKADGTPWTLTSIWADLVNSADITLTAKLAGSTVTTSTLTTAAYNNAGVTVNFGGAAIDALELTSTDFFTFTIDSLIGDTTVPGPALTSAAYNASANVLTVTGSGMTIGDTIDVSKLTLTGEGGNTYTLTSGNVTAGSSTGFSVTLNAADQLFVEGLLNKNGTTSASSVTTFNLAGAANWDASRSTSADAANTVTVSNTQTPTLTSAAYNASTGVVTVTGSNLIRQPGAGNDIDAAKLTFTGQGGGTYTLTASTGNVEIAGATSFAMTLGPADKAAVAALLNQNGISSIDATLYNIAAADNWNGPITGGNIGDLTGNGITVQNVADATSAVTSSAILSEPSGFATTAVNQGSAASLLDFAITDAGTSDGFATTVTAITVDVSGTTTDAERGNMVFLLNGPDAANVQGAYNAGTDKITFSGLNISVADAASETYAVSAYYNDNTSSNDITDGHTLILGVDADANFTTGNGGSTLAANQAAVTNGAGAAVDVTATRLVYSQSPSGTVASGIAFTTQPILQAVDARGNVDTGFTGNVALTEDGSGALGGAAALAATAGAATFGGVKYTAASDSDANFILTATAAGLTAATSGSLNPDVAATRLAFGVQPAPTSISSGQSTGFATVPVVQAVDADGLVDADYAAPIVLSVTDPNDGAVDGTVNSLSVASGDQDGSGATVTLSAASSGATYAGGIATFTGLAIQYTNAGASDSLALRAASGALTAANSSTITSLSNPAVTGVTSSTVNGAYKAGDIISIQVTFSQAVNVTGTPQLTLETGATDRVADYAGGSGGTTLTFTYTVQAGDTASDLDYTAATALALNGGGIVAASGGAAAFLTLAAPGAAGSLGNSKALAVDTAAPSWNTPTTLNENENSSGAFAALSASDGNSVSYAIVGGSDSAQFSLSGANLSFASPPDFENPADSGSDNTYEVTVRAADAAGNSADRTITVSVTNVNEAPAGINDTGSAAEAGGVNNGTAGSDAAGNVLTNDTDPDAGAVKSVTAVRAGSSEGAGVRRGRPCIDRNLRLADAEQRRQLYLCGGSEQRRRAGAGGRQFDYR